MKYFITEIDVYIDFNLFKNAYGFQETNTLCYIFFSQKFEKNILYQKNIYFL